MSRTGNVESTVHDELGIQLVFQNVDVACEEQDPQAISGKGAGSRKLIESGQQGELFTRSVVPLHKALGVTPTVWAVCVSVSEKQLRAEVSCPKVFQGDQYEGFSKRIFVVSEDLDPSVKQDSSDDDYNAEDFEVRIEKK